MKCGCGEVGAEVAARRILDPRHQERISGLVKTVQIGDIDVMRQIVVGILNIRKVFAIGNARNHIRSQRGQNIWPGDGFSAPSSNCSA